MYNEDYQLNFHKGSEKESTFRKILQRTSGAENEEVQKEWKMALEPRTEKGTLLGYDGNARYSVRVSVSLPVLDKVIAVRLW